MAALQSIFGRIFLGTEPSDPAMLHHLQPVAAHSLCQTAGIAQAAAQMAGEDVLQAADALTLAAD